MEEGLLLLANEMLPCIFWCSLVLVLVLLLSFFLEMWRSLERLGSIFLFVYGPCFRRKPRGRCRARCDLRGMRLVT